MNTNLHDSTNKLHFGWVLILITCLMVASGCTREDELLDVIETDFSQVKVDDLTRAMDFVRSEVRFEQKEFRNEVSGGLNRWLSYSLEDLKTRTKEWKLAEQAQPLVEQFAEIEIVKMMEGTEFVESDSYYIQQCYWTDRLLDRLDRSVHWKPFELYRLAADNFKIEKNDDNPLDGVFKKLQPELSDDERKQFVRTVKLFDWTCRNIQLEQSDYSEEELEQRTIYPEQETPQLAGQPGLGYQHFPWQSMMYGRGDYVDRAKVMLSSLQFWGIDGIMLATGKEEKPWAVGVLIGNDYYLFDTQMGLPIFREKIGSVATLKEVLQTPELVESLNLTNDESLLENTDYQIQADDLKNLTGLVYSSPESISYRFLGLENSLVGDDSLKLVVSLENLLNRLPDVAGLQYKPWDIVYKTHQYRDTIEAAMLQTSNDLIQNRLGWFFENEIYVDKFRPYRTARGRFFIGKFMVKEEERGLDATQGWKRLVYSKREIVGLAADPKLQSQHGLRKEGQSTEQYANSLKSVQTQMRIIREDAKFFIAQCLFDNGNEYASGSWLEDALTSRETDRWVDGVSYLLARSYESRGDYDKAIETLQNEELTFNQGNFLRARYLKQLIEQFFSE